MITKLSPTAFEEAVGDALAEEERVVETLVDPVGDLDLRIVGGLWLLVGAAVVDLEDERDARVGLRFTRLVIGREELVGISALPGFRGPPARSRVAIRVEHVGQQGLDLLVRARLERAAICSSSVGSLASGRPFADSARSS